MTREKSIKIFNKLNKIINGASTVISKIDSGANISQDKINKICMQDSARLAEALKEILKDIVESKPSNSNDTDPIVDSMLKTMMGK